MDWKLRFSIPESVARRYEPGASANYAKRKARAQIQVQ